MKPSSKPSSRGSARGSALTAAPLGGFRLGGRLRQYLLGSGLLFFDRVLRLAIGLAMAAYVGRHLGPTGFGMLAYSISFAAVFTGAAGFGFDMVLMRDLVREPQKRDALLGTAFVMSLGAVLLSLAVLGMVALVKVSDRVAVALIFAAGAAALLQPLSLIEIYFKSAVLLRRLVPFQIVAQLLSVAFRVYLVQTAAPILWFGMAQLADALIASGALLVAYRRQALRLRDWRLDRTVLRYLLRSCWPLALTSLLVAVYVNVDQLLIAHLLDVPSLGNYAAAIRISTIWQFLPAVILGSLFPSVLEAKRTEPEVYLSRLQGLHDLTLWLGIAVAVVTSALAPTLVHLAYGKTFPLAAGAAAIHVWSSTVVFIGMVSSYWLVAEDMQRLYAARLATSLVASVALNLVLIPLAGVRGAALAYVGAQLVSSTLFYLFLPSTRMIPAMQWRALLLPLRILRRAA